MISLFRNIRFYTLILTVIVTIMVYFGVGYFYPLGQQKVVKYTEVFALLSVYYLYFSLIISPFSQAFPNFPLNQKLLKVRRATGVSAFFFGLVHTLLSFFLQLGGFGGLVFLSDTYITAIALGVGAILILLIMTLTSLDYVVKVLSFQKWKKIHRLVYIAAIFVIVHSLMLGTHFNSQATIIPQTSFMLIVFLLFLEALRVDRWLAQKYQIKAHFGIAGLVWVVVSGVLFMFLLSPTSLTPSLSIHTAHIELAKEAQNQSISTSITPQLPSIPSLQGDRTRRFSVSFSHPDQVKSQQNVPLSFTIYDGSSGNPVQFYSNVYTKTMHLIIVDQNLDYFTHIHPTQKDATFSISTTFPHDGRYHVYINFQPVGAIEQTFGFVIDVGTTTDNNLTIATASAKMSDAVDTYRIDLMTQPPFLAKEMSIGQKTLKFHVMNIQTGQDVTTLKPYLASFGHLTLINTKSYDFLHIHPSNLVQPPPDANSGPEVEFLPLGIYGPIKPGTYKAFGEFNPDNKLIVTTFIITIE